MTNSKPLVSFLSCFHTVCGNRKVYCPLLHCSKILHDCVVVFSATGPFLIELRDFHSEPNARLLVCCVSLSVSILTCYVTEVFTYQSFQTVFADDTQKRSILTCFSVMCGGLLSSVAACVWCEPGSSFFSLSS